jgi:hypothetical protein
MRFLKLFLSLNCVEKSKIIIKTNSAANSTRVTALWREVREWSLNDRLIQWRTLTGRAGDEWVL